MFIVFLMIFFNDKSFVIKSDSFGSEIATNEDYVDVVLFLFLFIYFYLFGQMAPYELFLSESSREDKSVAKTCWIESCD